MRGQRLKCRKFHCALVAIRYPSLAEICQPPEFPKTHCFYFHQEEVSVGKNKFGEQLRIFRRNTIDPLRGGALSQERLADLLSEDCGIIYSRAAISDWERGKGHIHKDSRGILSSLISILHACGGIRSHQEADEWLETGNYRRLDSKEIAKISAEWMQAKSNEVFPTTLFSAPSLPQHKIIGRGEQLRRLKDHLFSGQNLALSAIDGLPGVGKTTLAIALAHDNEVQQFFSDGILWVGLGRNPDIFHQLGQWATNLGIPIQELERMGANMQRANAIHDEIDQKRMLIVMDDVWKTSDLEYFRLGKNCVHMLTTRQQEIALGFAGKNYLKVDELSPDSALELLHHLVPELANQYPKAAKEIVKNTGGLPLALVLLGNHLRIQLATGRKRRIERALADLTFAENRLGLTKDQPIISHEMHPSLPSGTPISLKAIIKTSDDALTTEAKTALRALSLFPPKPNSFSEEAAVAMLKNEMDIGVSILEILDELSDHGLVETTKQERYTLHQSIHDYAKTESNDTDFLAHMIDYYTQLATVNAAEYSILDKELDNITAAMNGAELRGELESVWKLLDAIFPFLEVRGYFDLALEYLTKLAAGLLPEKATANIQIKMGLIAYKRNHNKVAENHWKMGLELLKRASLPEDTLSVLSYLSQVTSQKSNYKLAEKYLLEATQIATSIENRLELCRAKGNLGRLAYISDRYLDADPHFEQALQIAKAEGYVKLHCGILNLRGLNANSLGNFEKAEQYYREGLKIARLKQLDLRVLAIMTNLGHTLRELGKYQDAEDYLNEGLEYADKFKDRAKKGHILMDLALTAFQMSKIEETHRRMQKAYDVAKAIENHWLMGLIESHWGLIKVTIGRFDEAKKNFINAQIFAHQASNNKEILGLIQLGFAQLALAANDPTLAAHQLKEGMQALEGSGHHLSRKLISWGEANMPNQFS